ncbi:hypothetical protein FRUB_03674 [Fimbriiglobus ruber]|uniref:Uncharacterized protein n=1 Tax=Fimbriiglobus ruber TaxID=1908690 RepID=A0A225DVE5_9BACT|nr:hypothetical protein FRUB_03674 [Fimbriiglobus ruber]
MIGRSQRKNERRSTVRCDKKVRPAIIEMLERHSEPVGWFRECVGQEVYGRHGRPFFGPVM